MTTVLAGKETIYDRQPPEMAWVAVAFLDFTVQLVRLSLSLVCMPCVVSAFEEHGDIFFPDQDIHLLSKRARDLIRVLPFAGTAVIFCRMRHRL